MALQKQKPKPGNGSAGPFNATGKPSTTSKKTDDGEFMKELVDSGRANWKKAPQAVRQRYRGIYLIMFSIPILTLTTFEMMKRLEGKSTKKVQQGEILDNREVRKFDEVEKWKVEKNSFMYKLFGRDFFLDGFTSKTMKRSNDDETK